MNLANNELKRLPKTIERLNNLSYLNLEGNSMIEVPRAFQNRENSELKY